jgi:hypothetical protein
MTAVEWLFEQLCSEKLSWNKDSNGKLFIDRITSDIFQQAKDIEKQQIIDAYESLEHRHGENYYNYLYKKQ